LEVIDQRQRIAFHNAWAAVVVTARLPAPVFERAYSHFLFFQSDSIFAPSFFDIAVQLIWDEGASSCALVNFDRSDPTDAAGSLFVETCEGGEDYLERLRAGGPSAGWLYQMDRYGCASDKAEWTIYCEKRNDIAIIGFRRSPIGRFDRCLEQLHARPIGDLVGAPSAAPVPYSMLTDEWKEALLQNYSAKP
jgi:hypothetical protein